MSANYSARAMDAWVKILETDPTGPIEIPDRLSSRESLKAFGGAFVFEYILTHHIVWQIRDLCAREDEFDDQIEATSYPDGYWLFFSPYRDSDKSVRRNLWFLNIVTANGLSFRKDEIAIVRDLSPENFQEKYDLLNTRQFSESIFHPLDVPCSLFAVVPALSGIKVDLGLIYNEIVAFRRRNRRMPDSIGELFGAAQKPVPIDPFSGKLYRYVLGDTEAKIYSVGLNRIDENGDGSADHQSSHHNTTKDIVLKFPLDKRGAE